MRECASADGHRHSRTLNAWLSGRRRSLLAELSQSPGAHFSPRDINSCTAVPRPLPPSPRADEPALTLPADGQERLMSLAVLHRSLEVKREVLNQMSK